MTSTSAMVFCAASWAAPTTKSLTERPWISAARRTTARALYVIRASNRAVRFCSGGIGTLSNNNVRQFTVHVKEGGLKRPLQG
jgi:hypothetical protein